MTQSTDQPTTSPVAVGRDEGEARWWFDALAVIKATAAGHRRPDVDRRGDRAAGGAGAPARAPSRGRGVLDPRRRRDAVRGRRHDRGDAGDYAWGPRGVPHRYTVGAAGCRMLFVCVPGGFEKLVVEMSEPAGSRTLPPPSEGPPDMERVAAVARANGCELLASPG